ncbi:response regulator [Kiloniella sp.]|uniref:response regulator n=1 Tax=Kiloniella sp. TaxID=1938587 RepID=UPI003B024DD9
MDKSNATILVCDDEPHLREMVCEYLEDKGYPVREASNARTLHTTLASEEIELVILDINMPGQDGLTALTELRKHHDVPVIMLTAASEVVDRIVGLEMGADDYLGKPVDLRELEARIKATLRRRPTEANVEPANEEGLSNRVAFGDFYLDLESAQLVGPDKIEVPITAMEYSLLRVFSVNEGRVLNRDQLLEQAHDRGWEPFDRSIDLRISRLRKKIERNPTKPEIIRTVRGIGYIFGSECS